jgi:HSP20 family protein
MPTIPKDFFERLTYFQREVEELFRRLFQDEVGPGALSEDSAYPPVDLEEAETEIVLRADLPGMEKDAIVLYGSPHFLVIRGTKQPPAEKWAYLRVERSFGPLQRLVVLPVPCDSAKVRARYERGVLEVRVPKVLDRRKIHRHIAIE